MKSSSPADPSFDVVVIGAGTAGLAAARAAHDEGARVAVVDHGPLGTFCTRLGCMPSKTLLQSTWALARARRLGALGIRLTSPPVFDWPAVRARERALVADFIGSVVKETKTSTDFTLIEGDAAFVDDRVLRVGARHVSAKGWVIATGSVPVRPPLPGLDDVGDAVLTSDDVFDLAAIPASVAVVGTGSVGVELGQFLARARAGAKVHLVGEDDRVAGLGAGSPRDALVEALGREVTLHASSRIERVKRGDAGDVTIALAGGETFAVEKILLAAGRRPDVEALGLDRIGVALAKGVPTHDDTMQTSHPSVFVAGDAAGAPALLHTAAIEGRTAGKNAARGKKGALARADLEPLMRIVFSDPIAATVGLDPEEAKAKGRSVCVACRPWAHQAKARMMDETDGVAQLVVDRSSRAIVGCQIVGPEADLLIHLVSYAIRLGAKVDDLPTLHHYHPTLAEMIPSVAGEILKELGGASR